MDAKILSVEYEVSQFREKIGKHVTLVMFNCNSVTLSSTLVRHNFISLAFYTNNVYIIKGIMQYATFSELLGYFTTNRRNTNSFHLAI